MVLGKLWEGSRWAIASIVALVAGATFLTDGIGSAPITVAAARLIDLVINLLNCGAAGGPASLSANRQLVILGCPFLLIVNPLQARPSGPAAKT